MKALSTLVVLTLLAIATLPLSATPSYCDSLSGNLVANCGFEAGGLDGWTLGGVEGFTAASSDAPFVRTGSFGAFMGAVGSDGTLSQTFLTLPGTVALGFFINNDGLTPNDFAVFWDGSDIGPNLLNAPAFDYNLWSGVFTSTGSDTLTFQARNDFGYFGLDDVFALQFSVATPEPGTVGMFVAGLGLMLTRIRAKRS
jgi:hypothetical protein